MRLGALLVAILAVLVPAVAEAHPLGNFTINHYSRIEPAGSTVLVHYVLDMAEIPTFQDRAKIDADQNTYADAKAAEILSHIHLTLDGSEVALKVKTRQLTFPEGQGGLPTLRLEILYAADSSAPSGSSVNLTYVDDNDPDRIGWREIVARPGNEQTAFSSSSVSAEDTSDELRNYPTDLLTSPLNVREAQITYTAGGIAPQSNSANPAVTAISHTTTAFAELANTQLSVQAVLLALVIAMFFGAQHALQPGHGKTIVAAYLVGSRGTPRHALFLGATVTATHTAGVYALGLVTLFLSRYIVPEKLYPVIGITSGLLVVGMGGWLLLGRLRALQEYRRSRKLEQADLHSSSFHAHPDGEHGHHTHEHADSVEGSAHVHGIEGTHTHGHEEASAHSHSHGGRVHSHLPPGASGEPITWRSLLALGVTGGALPCPEALVVLLATMALGRVAFGLLLIVAFSVGLAAVLVGFGLLMVYARGWFARVSFGTGVMPRILSLASALVIVAAGSYITLQAFNQSF